MVMVIIAMPLAAQTEQAVFAPFVSRLMAEEVDSLIRLSWIDSQDIHGPVYLYRSNTPFLGPDPALREHIAVIPYGEQSYVDSVPDAGTFYYFALASDENGRRFNYPIISINTISVFARAGTPPAIHEWDPYSEAYPEESIHPIMPVMGPPVMRPRVFVVDLEPFHRSADEHALASLVRGSFAARYWEAAKYDFITYLSVPRSQETRIRARFYLGQCLYFLQLPMEGLFEFLTIQDRFPGEIAEWIQATYNMKNYSITEY